MDREQVCSDRSREWFVPAFGPPGFRLIVGLLFLPYTGMVLAFTVMGAMLASTIYWDRVVAILVIYFLGLGVGAHALDALGSRGEKPWGSAFSNRQLKLLAFGSLTLAYAIGVYYMVLYTPLLWIVAILEGFITGGGARTDAAYIVHLDPGGALPGWLMSLAIEDYLPKVMKAVRERVRPRL